MPASTRSAQTGASAISRITVSLGSLKDEVLRLLSRPHTPNWMLARPVAGVRGATLIVNFPGSPRAIEQVARELARGLAHALALIAGRDPHSG
jgi:hypothetical protein